MPITEAAYKVLYENADVSQTFAALMSRAKKAEPEDAGWL
jgi:glycerol-3-phosphate dehydrogenase